MLVYVTNDDKASGSLELYHPTIQILIIKDIMLQVNFQTYPA